MAIPLLILLLVVVAIWLVVRHLSLGGIYDPKRGLDPFPEDFPLEPEEVTFFAEDRTRLTGLWFSHENAIGSVICCHGKSGNMLHRLHWVTAFHRLNLNVFLFDYRGFGASKGSPSERGLAQDARAAYEVVRAQYEDAEEPPVLIYGRSLGSAVAVRLAAERFAHGLILENAMTNIYDVAIRDWPEWLLRLALRQRFDSLSRIDQVDCPVLIAHSRDDELIPFEMGQELHREANTTRPLAQLPANHNDSGWEETPAYWTAIERFTAEAFAGVNA